MPLEWSSGWLLHQMAWLDANPEDWWKQPIPMGFFDEDEDGGAVYPVEPPAGWERLPMHEEVSDGE